jgi:hypothetical protein
MKGDDKMKKILIAFVGVMLLGALSIVSAESYWYSAIISTKPIADTSAAISISNVNVKVQQIVFHHITASTNTYNVYSSTSTTATKTLRGTIQLPATIGQYQVFGNNLLNGGSLTGSDLIALPFLYIRADNAGAGTYCATDTVQVIYKK